MNSAHNGYRFAEFARGESLQSPDVCDCCGREGLKKTVKLINPEGRVVWFGVGCAARAMSCPEKLVRREREDAIDRERLAARTEQFQKDQAEDAVWQAFLDGASAEHAGNRFKQIAALGGYPAARAQFLAAGGAR